MSDTRGCFVSTRTQLIQQKFDRAATIPVLSTVVAGPRVLKGMGEVAVGVATLASDQDNDLLEQGFRNVAEGLVSAVPIAGNTLSAAFNDVNQLGGVGAHAMGRRPVCGQVPRQK